MLSTIEVCKRAAQQIMVILLKKYYWFVTSILMVLCTACPRDDKISGMCHCSNILVILYGHIYFYLSDSFSKKKIFLGQEKSVAV